MRTLIRVLAALAVSVTALAAEAIKLKYTDLVGVWHVVRVDVNSDGMSTLVDDDPQFMGAAVEFSTHKIRWLKAAARPIDPAIDNCSEPPKVTSAGVDNPLSNFRVEGGFNILCGDGDWGPGGVVRPVDAETVVLFWYDKGILTLKRGT